MKHLKRYNEELKPDTYKSAGSRLRNIGHEERGVALSTYGHEQAGDILNFWVGVKEFATSFKSPIELYLNKHDIRVRMVQPNSAVPYSKDFTGYNVNAGSPHPIPHMKDIWDKIMYEVIRDYREGQKDLYIDFQISFSISPRQRSQFKDISNKVSKRILNGSETGIADPSVLNQFASDYFTLPMTLRLYLADGLYWDYEDDNGEMYTHNPTDEDFHEQFDNSYYPRFYLIESTPIQIPQGSGYIGRTILSTLASRQDANRFRSMVLPVLIERVKPLIQELFSEQLQTTPENFEKAVKVMNDLKVNSLFRDKIIQSSTVSDFKKQFFN